MLAVHRQIMAQQLLPLPLPILHNSRLARAARAYLSPCVLDKIDNKLRGVMQERGPGELSVAGQVQQLIHDATDISHLSQMFIWWMPWC